MYAIDTLLYLTRVPLADEARTFIIPRTRLHSFILIPFVVIVCLCFGYCIVYQFALRFLITTFASALFHSPLQQCWSTKHLYTYITDRQNKNSLCQYTKTNKPNERTT